MAKKIIIKTADDLKRFRILKKMNLYEFADKIAKKEIGDRPVTLRDELIINSIKWRAN